MDERLGEGGGEGAPRVEAESDVEARVDDGKGSHSHLGRSVGGIEGPEEACCERDVESHECGAGCLLRKRSEDVEEAPFALCHRIQLVGEEERHASRVEEASQRHVSAECWCRLVRDVCLDPALGSGIGAWDSGEWRDGHELERVMRCGGGEKNWHGWNSRFQHRTKDGKSIVRRRRGVGIGERGGSEGRTKIRGAGRRGRQGHGRVERDGVRGFLVHWV